MRKRAIAVLLAALLPLLSSCGVHASPPPGSGGPSASPAPVLSPGSGLKVKTDWSALAPYAPDKDVYTRLKEGLMPELVPSKDYGLLLPYVGEVFYDATFTGFDLSYKGLVTADGTMVTDDVYSEAYQATYYGASWDETYSKPLYVLAKYPYVPPDKGQWFGGAWAMHAVCAPDGSWVTPFDYTNVYCLDKVMMLVRDWKTNDVDVMDYGGHILYNLKDLPCADKLDPLFYYRVDETFYGEGYCAVRGGYLNELTGAYHDTGFEYAKLFSDGLAAVKKDGRWGYIDKSFKFVIAPMAAQYAGAFHNGRAYVDLSGGQGKLIDKKGHTLLTAWSIGFYDTDESGRIAYADSAGKIHVLDNNLKELGAADETALSYIPGGGVCVRADGKTTLYFKDKTYELPGDCLVTSARGNFIVCQFPADEKACLMTLDGKTLAETGYDDIIKDVVTGPSGKTAVILASSDYERPSYGVYAADGTKLFSGGGNAEYNALSGLLCVYDNRFFAYADFDGNIVFRLSLLNSLPD